MFEIVSICKGGGYRYCRTNPMHPKANDKGLYPLHRVLVENKLGRLLEPGEDVHHVNENKCDDSIENLAVLSKSEHTKLHRKTHLVDTECGACGKAFQIKAHSYRLRTKRSKSGLIFCSRSCGSSTPK